MAELPRLFTLPAAQTELARLGADVSTDTLRREIHRGRLRETRIGRRLFIREDHLLAYLDSNNPCHGNENDPPRSAATGSAKDPTVTPGAGRGSTPRPTDSTRIAWHR